jgi:hypothetical protein
MKKLSSYLSSLQNHLKWATHLTFAFKACVLIFFVFVSSKSFTQITPADCTQGCTSNDVQIQRAYLSNQAGTILPANFVCPASGTASVYLTLELTTKTPRVGVTIFTKIKTFTPPSTIGSEVSGSPISQCFGIALNQPTNKVTFQAPFNWTCGTAIVMTDIFIGWGTGNTNFCTGAAFQCPATPSKCYSLPPGSFVAIETPVPQNASATLCSDALGGTTATFNLNNISVTNSSNVTITWWENYTAPSTFSNQITTLSSYSSGSKTVYAKITSNSDASVFSVSTVTLTVNQTPNLSLHNPAAVCSPNTVDLTAAAVTAGSTIPANATLSYWTNSDGTGAVANPAAVGAGTYYIKATCSTTPVCSDIKSVTVTVNQTPANPTVSLTQPNCTTSTGTVTITAPLDGSGIDYEYSNNGGAYQDGLSFTVPAGGAYSVRARNKNGLCVSTGGASGTMGAQPSTPSFTVCLVQPTLCASTGSVTINATNGTNFTYKLNSGSPQASNVFSSLASGSVTSITVISNGVCSTTVNCADLVQSCPPTSRTATSTSVSMESTSTETTVKAYPNPFSDRIKFLVNSSVAGNGSLEIYNMMGQKVKTVYTGFINAGSQTFELSMPAQQVANLVYVLRVADKKMTGKILQINK